MASGTVTADDGACDDGLRDGGACDGGLRDDGACDGGLRDDGACDGGLRDGGLRDGGLRDDGLRDGGLRDGEACDGGEPDGGHRSLMGEVDTAARAVAVGAVVGVIYLALVAMFLFTTTVELVDPTRLLFPLLWLVLAATAIVAVDGWQQTRIRSLMVGVAYVAVLAWLSGLLQGGQVGVGVDLTLAVPGWGPVVLVDAAVARLIVVPFQLVGYLAAGLLFARAIDVSIAASVGSRGPFAAGLIGLFTCLGCVAPLLLAAGTILGLTGVTGTAIGTSMVTSTVALAATLFTLVYLVKRGECRRC